MNLFTGEASDAFFGGGVPPAVHALLHQAAEAPADQRAALLWTAQALAPDCLATYYVLVKHHAQRREFEPAERAGWRGLQEAAAQAGLPMDWRAAATPLPEPVRGTNAGRFWLFMLKALAFVHLRSGRPQLARELLLQLDACDPGARIGSDVTGAMLEATMPRRR